MFNKYDRIKDKVESYVDLAGNLIICNPSTDIHWEYYETLPLRECLADLLAYQLANGLSWIEPKEVGEKAGTILLGWDVQRDDLGKFVACYDIFRLPEYQVHSALKDLQEGKPLKFYRIVQQVLAIRSFFIVIGALSCAINKRIWRNSFLAGIDENKTEIGDFCREQISAISVRYSHSQLIHHHELEGYI